MVVKRTSVGRPAVERADLAGTSGRPCNGRWTPAGTPRRCGPGSVNRRCRCLRTTSPIRRRPGGSGPCSPRCSACSTGNGCGYVERRQSCSRDRERATTELPDIPRIELKRGQHQSRRRVAESLASVSSAAPPEQLCGEKFPAGDADSGQSSTRCRRKTLPRPTAIRRYSGWTSHAHAPSQRRARPVRRATVPACPGRTKCASAKSARVPAARSVRRVSDSARRGRVRL